VVPTLNQYTEANRDAWNEVMPIHQAAAKEKWDQAFMQPGFICMRDHEVALLKSVGIKGKAVAQLCCNNGVELLSLKNLGAAECVGFDISDVAIEEARERARRCQIDCQFVRTDVYGIGPEYKGRFDVVYISAGTLGWMPELPLFFRKTAEILKEGGLVFIHEIHPVSEMLPFDSAKDADVLRLVEPYFKDEPYVDCGGLDYVGGSQYTSTKPQYWFVHTLSGIVMGMVGNRISIAHFAEYATDTSAGHKRVEEANAGIPLGYIMVGEKQRAR
jgi:SAM-dependent methyltransferase